MSMSDIGLSTLTSPHLINSGVTTAALRLCQQSDHVADNLSITEAKASPWKKGHHVTDIHHFSRHFSTYLRTVSDKRRTTNLRNNFVCTFTYVGPNQSSRLNQKVSLPLHAILFRHLDNNCTIILLKANFEFDTSLLVQANQQNKTQLTTGWTSNTVHV